MPLPAVLTLGIALIGFANALPVLPESEETIEVYTRNSPWAPKPPTGICTAPGAYGQIPCQDLPSNYPASQIQPPPPAKKPYNVVDVDGSPSPPLLPPPTSDATSALALSHSVVFGANATLAAGLGMPVPAVLVLGIAQFGWVNAAPVTEIQEREPHRPPASDRCNCNENGCTPESPPCCANGTCYPYSDVLSSASSNSLSKSLIPGMGTFMAMALDLPLPAVLALGLAAQFGVANAVPVFF